MDSSLRILVIDDNRDAAGLLVLLLEQLGHAGRAAFNADSGIALAESFRPQVVFLDLILPDADGSKLPEVLREAAGSPACRVYALTAHESESDRARARQAGFDGYFLKPMAPARLYNILSASPAPIV
jgi:DNA-binding response OmpR family regulator